MFMSIITDFKKKEKTMLKTVTHTPQCEFNTCLILMVIVVQ